MNSPISEEAIDSAARLYVRAVNDHLGALTPKEWKAERADREGALHRAAVIGIRAALPAIREAVAGGLVAENARLREACQTMIDWDAAEKGAEPYDKDGGASFYKRMELCSLAFDRARTALAIRTALTEQENRNDQERSHDGG